MAKTEPNREGEVPPLCRLRYLVDIILLTAAAGGVERVVGAIYVPASPQSGVVFDLIVKVPVVLLAWLLIRLRKETLAEVGLERPRHWWHAFVIGLLVAAVVYAAADILEKMGLHRDLSHFKPVHGNLRLAVYEVVYAFVGAGFYEELIFRGFVLQGLAMIFGASRYGWTGACVLQALLFGLAHAYQNPVGVAFTGAFGLLMGFLFLFCKRNLWPLIVGHGLYDAGRFVLFYFKGPPLG